MFGAIIRFIGTNLVGLGTGYLISDLWNDLKPGAVSPGEGGEKKGSFFTEFLKQVAGWPKWLAALAGIVLLIILADRLGYIRKK